MVTTNGTARVAERVASALGDRPVKWLADETAIPYTTLTRRMKDGNFTAVEMFAIADALAVAPALLVGDAA